MKFLSKIAILYCCIFTTWASVQCASFTCIRKIERHNNKSITNTKTSINDGELFSIAYNNGTLYVGSLNGNVWSYTGGTWINLGYLSSLDGGYVDTITFDSSNNVYVGTSYGSIWEFNGTNWTKLNSGLVDAGNSISSLIMVSGTLYAATVGGNVFQYAGSGNWTKLPGNSILTPDTLDSSQIGSLASDSSGNIYASTYGQPGWFGGHVFKYSGESWSMLSGSASSTPLIPDLSLDGNPIWSVAVDSLDNIHAGTFGANVFQYNTLTSSWGQVGSTLADNGYILFTAFGGGTTPYVSTYAGNVYTYNALTGWTQVGGSSPDGSAVWQMAFDSLGNLYVSTDNGNVFEFNGTSWNQL